MTSHPDYGPAKRGDTRAAARLIADLVTQSDLSRALARFGKGVIFAPVHAEEPLGRNKIPLALAKYYADETGGEVADEIVQANRLHHTGAGAMERLISRARFDGAVRAGRRYVLVDDANVLGGTLAELANHVRENGGDVVGVVTLVDYGAHGRYAPFDHHLKAVEAKYGSVIRDELGIEPTALTADEARYLAGRGDVDRLRAEIAAARSQRRNRLRWGGIREDQGGASGFGEPGRGVEPGAPPLERAEVNN